MFIGNLFEKYADLKVIRYFLENPEAEIHVKELARTLDVSAATVSSACKSATEDGILTHKKIANVHLYALNQDSDKAKALREVIKHL